jgi:type IV pilus assembly protein PilO
MNPNVEKFLKIPFYQKFFLFLLIIFAIVVAFVFLFFIPKKDELTQLQQKNQQAQVKLLEDRRIAANLPKFKAEYEKMKEQLNLALTELPNQSEIPALLSSIAALAKDSGLEIIRFKPGSESPKGFYAEVPVDLVLAGSFHEAALFFQNISGLSRIVNITNVQLGNPKTAEGVTRLTVDCLAVTFRFIEETKGK